ncbi:hypothetical protein CCR94_07460 [Rhodoblastus sphagnicola]|uniref:DUF2809 domain-containing protein n=1 Tax=Rhodoblastus sphagnicola TaxID=333368 RepID=A0A2S6NBN3_9HYPH|nr:DUF2809 domain-containing protein [Rhodoblastus sphagnicola]MBB4199695.1 hypothetical protein [Rhodoblastus sphagnicola]PPQ32032.1 hypothetical protein CCR94_07460 [Rhodoblastus sphagnicola]
MTVSIPLKRTLALALIIAGGVVLRAYGHKYGVPAFWVKYGGSALWAAMYFFFFALLLRSRPRAQVLYIAALICALIEFVKLVHTPALDVFRMTATGAWTLGRVFSAWNFVAYAAGLAGAYGLDRVLGPAEKKSGGRRR